MAKVKAEKTESSKTKKSEPTPEINLGDVILASINEQFKTNNYKAAFHLTDPDVISDVTDWVSTGCSVLDLAIANLQRTDGKVDAAYIGDNDIIYKGNREKWLKFAYGLKAMTCLF